MFSNSKVLAFDRKKLLISKERKLSLFRFDKNLSRIKKIFDCELPNELKDTSLIRAKFYSKGFILFDFSTNIFLFDIVTKSERTLALPQKPRLVGLCQNNDQLLILSKFHRLYKFDLARTVSSPERVLDSFNWKVLQLFLDSDKMVFANGSCSCWSSIANALSF